MQLITDDILITLPCFSYLVFSHTSDDKTSWNQFDLYAYLVDERNAHKEAI